ncbi:hypothetical protein GF373_09995 [bacterium]|nr:hypothetical protein [bacterium]
MMPLRQRMIEDMKLAGLSETTVWKQGWNSFCKPYGKGAKAALNYLGRYIYRVAISNNRFVAMDETHVTFRYKPYQEKRWRTMRLRGEEFLRRFVMHALPRGLHKVRYYGLWHHSQRKTRHRIRLALSPKTVIVYTPKPIDRRVGPEDDQSESTTDWQDREPIAEWLKCPNCNSPNVRLIGSLERNRSP